MTSWAQSDRSRRRGHERSGRGQGSTRTLESDDGRATHPSEFSGTVEPPKGWAAGGLAAVGATLRHAGSARWGSRRAPCARSCAGEPARRLRLPGLRVARAGHAHASREFCENGAKAVAEEATTERDHAGVLRRALDRRARRASDYWLGQQGRLTEPMVQRRGPTHYEPISWDEAFELIAAELRGLASPDEAAFYTSGRTSNEAAFLYQLFVRSVRHEQPARLLEHVPRVERRRADRDDRHRQGHGRLDDFDAADLIFVVGQNPGTNHPRMLTALRGGEAGGATIVGINPLPEAGLTRFTHPQRPLDLLGRHRARRRAPPGPDRRRPRVLQGRQGDARTRRRPRRRHVLDTPSSSEHTTASTASRDARRSTGTTSTRPAASPATIPNARRARPRVRAHDRVLGDGPHAAPQRGRDDPGDRELAAAARQHRPSGRRRVPGARTLQRAGRSHDGHLRAAAGRVPRRARREFGFEPPRAPGLDTVDTIHAMRDGEVRVFFGWAATSSPRRPTPRYPRRARALQAHGAGLDQAEPRAPGHRRPRADPAVPRPHRASRGHGVEQFVTVEDSMSMVHRSQGVLRRPAELRSEVAIVGALAEALGDRRRLARGSSARIAGADSPATTRGSAI